MGAMKRELERLADIVIYGTPETIQREFTLVAGLLEIGPAELFSYAVEQARYMSPLCECGADYFTELHAKYPKFVEQTNGKATSERV